jgi:hypothetical protein
VCDQARLLGARADERRRRGGNDALRTPSVQRAFTSIAVTSRPSAWKVIVYDESGMILRLPVPAGPRRRVLQAVLEAIEAEW